MSISGAISGIVLVILGVFLIVLSVVSVEEKVGMIVLSIYGIIALGVGVYMLLNSKKEDLVELIKTNKKK